MFLRAESKTETSVNYCHVTLEGYLSDLSVTVSRRRLFPRFAFWREPDQR